MPGIGGEIGKDRILGGLLKTGQTTRYGGYEDDGYFEKGLSKRYTILAAGQYAGTTDITLNAKTDAHSNNCVYDQRTKLMWSRYAVGSVGPGSDGKLPWTTNGNGEGIFAYVAAANAAKLGGYDDWRVPNAQELPSLLNYQGDNAKPDPTSFPDFNITDYYWTSTTLPNATSDANLVSFNWGIVPSVGKATLAFLLLVRGG